MRHRDKIVLQKVIAEIDIGIEFFIKNRNYAILIEMV